jgi:hypothetical protein
MSALFFKMKSEQISVICAGFAKDLRRIQKEPPFRKLP